MSDASENLDDWANPPQWWSTAITETGDFFYHLNDGWEAARPFAPVALITLILAATALALLVRTFLGGQPLWIRVPLSIVRGLAEWISGRAAQTDAHPSRETSVLAALRHFGPLRIFLSWCALCDTNDLRRIADNYKDGPVQANYQLNMGLAVLVVSIWSSLAFAYAVYSSGASFGGEASALPIVAAVGGVLYGTLILALDRSIVAPFSPNKGSDAGGNSSRNTWSGRILSTGIYARTIARILIALMVAKFTAVPLTALIMHDGIYRSVSQEFEDKRSGKFLASQQAGDQLIKAQEDKAKSPDCVGIRQQLGTLRSERETVGRQGCHRGISVCPGTYSDRITAQISQAEADERAYCYLSNTEESPLRQRWNAANKEYQEVVAPANVDILTAATAINRLELEYRRRNSEADSMLGGLFSRDPIAATFWLLVVIELIPALMKLWREQLVDRRMNVLRSADGVSGRRRSDGARPIASVA